MTNYDILKEYEAHKTPVPSYGEWKAFNNGYEATIDANLKQATWMVKMEEENQKLKELLKECNLLLIKQQANDEVEHKESVELVLRIDEVLQ